MAVILDDEKITLKFRRDIAHTISQQERQNRVASVAHIDSRSPARITIHSNASKEFPVSVAVRQQIGVLAWQLPYTVESQGVWVEYAMVSRTLCPVSNYYKVTPVTSDLEGPASPQEVVVTSQRSLAAEEVIVSVSSASEENVRFTMSASVVQDFYVRLNEERTMTISPSEPQFFAFEFPPHVSTVLLEVDSPDDTCMTISVQNTMCPVFDLEYNVQYGGLWQTVTTKGGVTITKEKFPGGLFLVFVVRGDDRACLDDISLTPRVTSEDARDDGRLKTVTFRLQKTIAYSEYVLPTLGAFGVFVACYLVAFVVILLQSLRNRHGGEQPGSGETTDEMDCLVQEDDTRDSDYLRNKVDAGEPVFVSDMARKRCKTLRQDSQMYLWNLLTVATFYSLPVLQLVITYQKVLHNTGNHDLCFYNFLCSHPVFFLSDFNHVFSNLGYVMLGLLFVFLIFLRERSHLNMVANNSDLDQNYGLPQQFGLFYAMGAALIAEGILSACYHVCPNYSNFQFDTSFMYVIAMMCMLRIYQNRHPDIHASAYTTFGALAVVMLCGMTGVMTSSRLFWVLFAVLHVFVCLVLSAQVYFMGFWSLDWGTLRRVIAAYTPRENETFLSRLKPTYVSRMTLLIFGNIVNFALAVASIAIHPFNFANYLLAIFMANLNIYMWLYIIMKLLNREGIGRKSIFFILLSIVLWGLSLNYFFRVTTSWEHAPAISRTYNHQCEILDFYDYHDIWHFISAGSMFSSFMVLLTLDDNLQEVPRSEINVF